MDKRGFTLVEVIVSFVLVTAVSMALFKTTVAIQQRQKVNIALNSFKAFSLAMNNEIQYDFLTDRILSTTSCGTNCYDINFDNRGTVRITLNREDGTITYGSFKEKLPNDYTFYDDMKISSYTSATPGLNSYVALTIPIKSNYESNLSDIKYMYEYDSTKTSEVNLNLPNMDDVFANKIGTGGLIRDNNGDLRYQGSSVNNYVTFNNESAGWRIVGIFNGRVKLVRKDSIGVFSWDSSVSTINSGYGINEWSESDIKTVLNDYYYDGASNVLCYNDINNANTTCSFNGLTSGAKKLIDYAIWNLGGSAYNISLSEEYVNERGNVHISNPSDGVGRKDSWTGKVGLLYPSDFGYASGNTSCKDNLATYANCGSDNWLKQTGAYWTITPLSTSSYYVLYVNQNGYVGNTHAATKGRIYPSVYLKPNVKVTGEGTTSNPYVFSLN